MKHGISTQDSVDIELYDRHGTPIEQDDFTLVIEQYRQFEDFCIVIDINTKGAFTFSSEVRRTYILIQIHFNMYFKSKYNSRV